MEILEKPGSKQMRDSKSGSNWNNGGRGGRDVSYDRRRLIFNDDRGSLDGDGRSRGRSTMGLSGRNIATKNITDAISLYRDTLYGENIFPDIIDVKPLMSSRDELVLPRDELFSATDIRSLIIFPFSRPASPVYPILEFFVIFLFSGLIRLITATRSDISISRRR